MRIIVVTLCICLFPLAGWAVDGYKNAKFGISKEAFKKVKLCNFEESINYVGDNILICDNLPFYGQNRIASAYFLENEFLMLTISIPPDSEQTLLESLDDKYGNPSHIPSEDEVEAVMQFPNREYFITFDKDTVVVRRFTDERNRHQLFISYQSPKFEKIKTKQDKQKMKISL